MSLPISINYLLPIFSKILTTFGYRKSTHSYLLNTCFIFLYQLVIRLYGLAISIAAWFKPKAKLWIKGRKDIFEKLNETFKAERGAVIWMHCASLGEFEQGRPFIEQLKEKYPHYKILLTFFSPSGYEIRKNYPLADYVFYIPLDTPANAKRFIAITQPKLAFFVKYEFWYFYLKTLKEKKIPYYLIAGVFRPNHLFFKPYGKWYLEAIQGFEKLFLIDQGSLTIANQHGLQQAILTGDPRIDRVAAIAKNAPPIPVIKAFKGDKKLFILGSAHEKDWGVFFDSLKVIKNKKYFKDWRFMIAPHEIGVDHLTKIVEQAPFSVIRYTKWDNQGAIAPDAILVLDTIGQLSAAYQYGDLAFIGGGFDRGIHNILEPAAFGVGILFGPNYGKFSEAKALVTQGGALYVKDSVDLISIFEQWSNDEETVDAGKIAKDYIEGNIGSTKLILEELS